MNSRGRYFALLLASYCWPSLAETLPLFQTQRLHMIHLRFTEEQWTALEPKQSGDTRGPAGGPGMRRPPFGAMFARPFLEADSDGDGTLSAAEFRALGAAWFQRWAGGAGELTADQLRRGLEKTFAMPPMGGLPGGPGGPGGPGRGLLGAEGGRNGMSAAAGIDFQYVHADLDFNGRTLTDVAVRYKGNKTYMMSRNSLKRPLKIDLNKFVKGQKLEGQTTLNLHNNVTDPSAMNETLSYRLFREAGVPSPATGYARVYVTVPGRFDRQYFGLYSLVEDIDKEFAEDRFHSKDGAIFKPVTRELFQYLGDDWSRYRQIYDPKTQLTAAHKARVIDFAKLVTSADDAQFAVDLPQFLDVKEFAAFLAMTVWLSNRDSILGMGQNFYVYLHPKSNTFQFLPWDLDHSFGQFRMGGGDSETLSIARPWQGPNRFLERVFAQPDFQKEYRARLADFQSGICKPERLSAMVEELAKVLRHAVAEEGVEKVRRFDMAMAGRSPAVDREGPGFGGPGGGAPIKAFVTPRWHSVANQLAGKPAPEATAQRERGRGPGPGRGFPSPPAMLEQRLRTAFDTDRNESISRDEFQKGFAAWFDKWNTDRSGRLTNEQLQSGIEGDLAPFPAPPRP
ncbi:MAG: CotH kinase family protein [Bryobacterales bacterium]|nr:CotH kinase family protein [Bryobacterales bacterium]